MAIGKGSAKVHVLSVVSSKGDVITLYVFLKGKCATIRVHLQTPPATVKHVLGCANMTAEEPRFEFVGLLCIKRY